MYFIQPIVDITKVTHYAFLSTPSVWRATLTMNKQQAFIQFLSTPSVWRATYSLRDIRPSDLISIHALRVEGDHNRLPFSSQTWHFYPRPPCGGRRGRIGRKTGAVLFLSTPSVWRATAVGRADGTLSGFQISIHALRVEGDESHYLRRKNHLHFYPRPPCGGRHGHADRQIHHRRISIHALRVEGDLIWVRMAL